jgi:hypothetical protein
MVMVVEQLVDELVVGEAKGENLPQCHFVHHRSQMT